MLLGPGSVVLVGVGAAVAQMLLPRSMLGGGDTGSAPAQATSTVAAALAHAVARAGLIRGLRPAPERSAGSA